MEETGILEKLNSVTRLLPNFEPALERFGSGDDHDRMWPHAPTGPQRFLCPGLLGFRAGC
jgi:hypothetical protein